MEKNIKINQAISGAATLEQVLTIVHRDSATMNIVNCVTALQKLAKLGVEGGMPPILPVINRTAKCFEGGEKVQPRQVSGCLWALAKLEMSPTPLLGLVLRRGSTMRAAWFKTQELAMTVWALGKLSSISGEADAKQGAAFVAYLLPDAVSRSDMNSQNISNLFSGVALVGATPSAVSKLTQLLRTRLHEFVPQELANTISNFVKVELPLVDCPGFAQKAAAVIQTSLGSFEERHLANLSWATVKLLERSAAPEDRAALDFWTLFASAITSRAENFNAPELSMCSWAAAQSLAGSTEAEPSLVRNFTSAVARRTIDTSDSMDAQQLSTITLSLIKLGCSDRAVLKNLSKASRLKLGDFTGQDLDSLASGFARHELKWRSPKLVAALSLATATLLQSNGQQSPSPRNLANLLSSVAKLSSTCKGPCEGTKELVCAASREMLQLGCLSDFNLKDLANSAWGFAILGHAQQACMLEIGRHAAPLLNGFNAQECSRLLFAMRKCGVRCEDLEAAASSEQDITFPFSSAVGPVVIQHVLGGTQLDSNVREDTGAIAGNGGALFLDSFVAAEWLSRQRSPKAAAAEVACMPSALRSRDSWAGLTLVELGAGAGLCSIVAQKMGMRVVATDGDESVLDQLVRNAARNPCAEEGGGSQVCARLLKWGTDSPLELLGLTNPPHVVVCNGCVYGREPGVWQVLVDTLVELTGEHTVVVMAHGTGAAPGVHQLRGKFYEMAAPFFEVTRAPDISLHADSKGCQLHFLVRRPGRNVNEHKGPPAAGAAEGPSEVLSNRKRKKEA
jgi:hypothetical protein